jgi:peptidoglycan/LPS O-acetylase OafA/YrhL
VITILLQRNQNILKQNFIVKAGKMSFGVFLSHMFVVAVFYVLNIRYLHLDLSGLMVQVLLIVLTLLVSLGIIGITRALNKELSVKYLG